MKHFLLFIISLSLVSCGGGTGGGYTVTKEFSDCPLCEAVIEGDSDQVEVLLSAGMNPDTSDKDDITVLMIASKKGNVDVIHVLLDADANPNLADNNGKTALIHAVEVEGYVSYISLLLGGANPNLADNNGKTALMIAAYNGDSSATFSLLLGGGDLADLMLGRKVGEKSLPNLVDNNGQTALMLAAYKGHSDVVETLLSKSDANPNLMDNNGQTALMLAVLNGHVDAAKILLHGIKSLKFSELLGKQKQTPFRKGASLPNLVDNNGQTALMLAALSGHDVVAEMLLAKGENPNLVDNEGKTALIYAAQKGHTEIAKTLLYCDANPDIRDNDGVNAWYWVDEQTIISNIFNQYLSEIKGGKIIESCATKAVTVALLRAAHSGDSWGIEILLREGANPNLVAEDDLTALMIAARYGHVGVAKILLGEELSAGVAQLLISKGVIGRMANPNVLNKDGWTALMYAAQEGHAKVVQMLLDKGANLDVFNKDDWTALKLAAYNDHAEVAQILLDKGANPDVSDKHGWTALMYAAWNGHAEVAKILLDGGAKSNASNKNGFTALMLAAQEEKSEVAKILLYCGASPDKHNNNGGNAWNFAKDKPVIQAIFDKYLAEVKAGKIIESCGN